MRRGVRDKLTFSNVVSVIALFVALGGSSYAALQLPRNSVGTHQLRAGAVHNIDLANRSVTGAKVRNGTLTESDFAKGLQIPFPPTLPSGDTLYGNYSAGGQAAGANAYATDSISFGYVLAQRPTAHLVKKGDPPPAACPGNVTAPAALPGHLCVYESLAANAGTRTIADSTQNLTDAANWYGAHINLFSAAAGAFDSAGTWAMTAP